MSRLQKFGLILTAVIAVIGGLVGWNYLHANQELPSVPLNYDGSIALDSNGIVTYDELVKDVQSDAVYSKLDFKGWDTFITQHGINHIDDSLLQTFINGVPDAITQDLKQLSTLVLPNALTISSINSQVATLQTQRNALQVTLNNVRANAVSSSDQKQQAANNVAAVDGQISTISQPLQIPGQIAELNRHITSIREKFACAIEEQTLRSTKQVNRTYVHSVYYLDFTANSGTLTEGLTGITFTNAVGMTCATGTFATAGAGKIVAGDYVRVSNGTQWYKVNVVTNNTTATLTPTFQQATVTDTANATLVSCPATHDGRTAKDGTSAANAFSHINEYTTDTTRTAGDTLQVRGGQTHHLDGISVTFDESGTPTSYLEIDGWTSATSNPWSDGATAQPIFDFGNTAFKVNTAARQYWKIYNLNVQNNNLTGDGLISWTSFGNIIDTCTISLNNHALGQGLAVGGGGFLVTGCNLYSNKDRNISVLSTNSFGVVSNCVINGGAAGTNYGIYNGGSYSTLEVSNTTEGVTTVHATADVFVSGGGIVRARNCISASPTPTVTSGATILYTSEDNGQVFGAQKAWYNSGTVTKTTTTGTIRSSGGTSSALMLPSSIATFKYPLNLAYGSLNPDFAIYCPASPITATVYVVPSADWYTSASYPSTYPDDNLIINSTFETNVTGWTASGGDAITRQTTQFKYGAASARIVRTTTDGYAAPTALIGADPFQSKTITFSCWAWTATANTSRLALNDGYATQYSSYCAGDSAWHLLTVSETINANATYIIPRLVVDTSNATAYFDAALLYPPVNTQLTLTADYYSSGSTRTTTAASTQHVWDNAEPTRGSDGVFATYAADAGTNTTTMVDTQLTGGTDDYYKGWLLVNTTRNLGSMITGYTASTHTATLATAITGQTTSDTYYVLNWVGLSVTFTPSSAGFAYLKLNLGLYLSGAGIYVDAKPIAQY
jgi:hypothetical protein